jgi:hypothetical protein
VGAVAEAAVFVNMVGGRFRTAGKGVDAPVQSDMVAGIVCTQEVGIVGELASCCDAGGIRVVSSIECIGVKVALSADIDWKYPDPVNVRWRRGWSRPDRRRTTDELGAGGGVNQVPVERWRVAGGVARSVVGVRRNVIRVDEQVAVSVLRDCD